MSGKFRQGYMCGRCNTFIFGLKEPRVCTACGNEGIILTRYKKYGCETCIYFDYKHGEIEDGICKLTRDMPIKRLRRCFF